VGIFKNADTAIYDAPLQNTNCQSFLKWLFIEALRLQEWSNNHGLQRFQLTRLHNLR
jgi:hypothetical protein